MSDVKTGLRTLGWRVDRPARLAQAVKDFQRGWNLGTALTVGSAGPATRAALELSLSRKAAGKPDFSANFSAHEFACACDGEFSDCRRIWVNRRLVRAAEKYRTLVGPFTPERGCRCPGQNRRVNGRGKSQHLYGNALDVPVYAVSLGQVKALGVFSGIGLYDAPGGKRVPRHVDVRHIGPNTTNGTVRSPTTWDYGDWKKPLLTPAPVATSKTRGDDSMSAAEVAELKAYIRAVAIDGYTANGKKFPSLAEVDIENQRRIDDVMSQVAALSAKVDALAASAGTVKLDDNQLMRALRELLTSLARPGPGK
jgi:hypothetical protein